MGTRGSALARAQSGMVAAEITRMTGIEVETVLVKTEGDHLSVEGKAPPGGDLAGVFTRALDAALREGKIDFAVHSLKDVPTEGFTDLVLAAVPEREDARDALVVATRHAGVDAVRGLPKGARVATSSPRRVAQLLRLRPDLVTVPMPGNVDTRLQRLEEGRADALLLAVSGLVRLGRSERITRRLDVDEFLPAPGQGALALVCRADDAGTRGALKGWDHAATRAAVLAERALLSALRGGCRAPVGTIATVENGTLKLRARVLSLDGRESFEGEGQGSSERPEVVGRDVATSLERQGAARLVAAAHEVA